MGANQEEGTAVRNGDKRCFKFLQVLLRVLIIILGIVSLVLMLNSNQTKHISILTLKAHWKDSKAFISLIVVTCITIPYSFMQAFMPLRMNKSLLLSWLLFIGDQMLAYALLGSAAASVEVAYIAKHGSSHAKWNEICSVFDVFCNRAGASIILAFLAVPLLAIASVISAFHLFTKLALATKTP